MHISLTAGTAVCDYRALAGHHEVGKLIAAILVEGESTRRHPHDQVRPVVAILLLAATGLTVASDQARLVFKIEQGRETLVDLEDNVAASAAVTAGGAAERAILFAQ